MRVNQVKEVIGFICANGEVPMLVGHAGIGKTQSVKDLAAQTGRELHILMLSQMEPGDLLGLPVRDASANKTVYMRPDWFPETGNSIVFLDEINRAHESVRHAVMQLILDRRINNHVLPEGTWIVAAMNPATEDYMVDDLSDAAFLDRFVWLKVTSNTNDYIDYLTSRGYKAGNLMAKVVRQLDEYGLGIQMSGQFDIPELQVTPRAIERFTKLYSAMTPEFAAQYAYELARGILGSAGLKIYELLKKAEEEASQFGLDSLLSGDIEAAKRAQSLDRIQIFKALVMRVGARELDYQDCVRAVDIFIDVYSREEQMSIIREVSGNSPVYSNGISELKKIPAFAKAVMNLIGAGSNAAQFLNGLLS